MKSTLEAFVSVKPSRFLGNPYGTVFKEVKGSSPSHGRTVGEGSAATGSELVELLFCKLRRVFIGS